MAKVTYEDGTVINFDGTPTQNDIEEAYNQVKGITKSIPQDTLEDKISQRQDAFSGLTKLNPPTINQPLAGMFNIPAQVTGKTLSILGGLGQRVEALGSNVVEQIQKGKINPLLTVTPPIAYAVNPAYREAINQGITGKRLGEYGDIGRRAGFPEPVNVIGGLAGSIAMQNWLTGGMISKNVKVISSDIKTLAQEKAPQIMNDKWLIDKAQKTGQVTDKVIKDMNTEIGNFYNTVSDVPVNRSKIQDIISNLWGMAKEDTSRVIQEIKDKFGGTVKTTVGDAKKLKDIVQDYIPESVWLKGKKGMDLTPAQQKLTDAYFGLKKVIHEALGKEVSPTLATLEDKATNIYRTGKVIKRMVVDETGKYRKTSQLVNIFKGNPAQAGRRSIFNDLSKMNEEAQQIIKDMGKFTGRQATKKFIKKVVGAGLVGYSGYEIIKKLLGKQ